MNYNCSMTLTGEDLKAIRELISSELELKLEEKLESKLEEKLELKLEQKLKEKLALFPTRQEFLTHMDQIMTELRTIRQEQEFQVYRLRDHEDRITSMEETGKSSKK